MPFQPRSQTTQVRQPAAAGTFYPSDPGELSRMVESLLDENPAGQLHGDILGAVVPHAGYTYSGPTAARIYNLLKGMRFDTVVIIGASHHAYTKGAALAPYASFETPLGKVEVDEKAGQALEKSCPLIESSRAPHIDEHSVEIQIPFLQKVLKSFRIVPLLTSVNDLQTCQAIGTSIGRFLKGRKSIILASSDLSHFPSRDDAERADLTTLKALETMDPGFFIDTNRLVGLHDIPGLDCTWCGQGAVTTALIAAREMGANSVSVVSYTNSGDLPHGDPHRTVGYAAALFLKGQISGGEISPARLNEDEQQELLTFARKTLQDRIDSGKTPKIPLSKNPKFNLPAAVFVTLFEKSPRPPGEGPPGENLRGCIGTTSASKPLLEAVADYALNSALRDPRFPPVSRRELSGIEIEISALSPLSRVTDPYKIRPGIDGVVVQREDRHGLFLPQVWKALKERDEFMGRLCTEKAALPRDSWKDPKTEIFSFTVQAFRENR